MLIKDKIGITNVLKNYCVIDIRFIYSCSEELLVATMLMDCLKERVGKFSIR